MKPGDKIYIGSSWDMGVAPRELIVEKITKQFIYCKNGMKFKTKDRLYVYKETYPRLFKDKYFISEKEYYDEIDESTELHKLKYKIKEKIKNSSKEKLQAILEILDEQ